MNEHAQQSNQSANVEVRKMSVLRAARCDPSLKSGFRRRYHESGFATEADTLRQLARDFVAGRIVYIGGILQPSQEKIA